MSSKDGSDRLTVEAVDPRELRLDPDNPRHHSSAAVKKLVRSIEAFGWTSPILVRRSDKTVLAGHKRLKAALELGMEKVPVVYLDLEGDEGRVYMLADNVVQSRSDWDFKLLAEHLLDLDARDVDLVFSGFDPEELKRMMEWAPEDHGAVPDVKVRVGRYTFYIDAADYGRWREKIIGECGGDEEAVLEEIRRRLQI